MLLTEKSHELCDIMDILLVNNEMLIRGRVTLLGNSVRCDEFPLAVFLYHIMCYTVGYYVGFSGQIFL